MIPALALTLALAATPIPRVTIHVNALASCAGADGSAAQPYCTIGEALAIAGVDDEILVAPGVYSEALDIAVDLTIVGVGGPDVTIVDATGLNNAAVVATGVSAVIRGLTLRRADERGLVVGGALTLDQSVVEGCAGGGIEVDGPSASLTAVQSRIAENIDGGNSGAGLAVRLGSGGAELTRCEVIGNVQGFEGGGIYSEADLTLRECTIAGNSAAVSGGGVMAFVGDLFIEACTIEDNETDSFGAGLYGRGLASFNVINTTISGNRLLFDFGSGAGAYVEGNAAGRIDSCTITGNSGSPAAGIFLFSPGVTLRASIVAGNLPSSGGAEVVAPGASSGASEGFNVIGPSPTLASASSDVTAADPLLLPLAWNGGFTRTHAPAAGSPCIGLNTLGTPFLDQRGAVRSGFSNESGAFELIGDPAFCDGAPNSTLSGATLQASGSSVAAVQALVLHAAGVPAGSFGFFLVGDGTQAMVPMNSQGTFCVGGNIGRFDRLALNEVKMATADGRISLSVDPSAVPSATGIETLIPGDTRYFQLWYRDRNPGVTSNFSSAIGIMFD